MIELASLKPLTTAILLPIIKNIFELGRKAGIKGINKWNETKYHARIQRKISSIETLKTFWSADKEINLTDFYYPSKIEINGGQIHCQYLSDLPTGNLIFEGIVGQGKSIYLRHLATSDIRSNQADKFPIFIEFRTLNNKINLENAIRKYLEEINIDAYDSDTFEFIMHSGKFILLLDAFDEIEDHLVKSVYQEIDHFLEKYGTLRIVITSRPSAEIQKSSKFKIIKIASLKEADYTPFLSKLGLTAIFISEIKHSIKNSPSNISELITTPLMLTLVVIAYRSANKIPENLPEFFDILFRCVFSGHDNAKPTFRRTYASGISENKLQELFEAFCFVCLHNKITRSLNTSQFDSFFLTANTLIETSKCESANFRMDMNRVACLILPDGYENWVFLHKSVMEYYAASFIKKSNESFAEKFYAFSINDPQNWMEVLTFLNYIDDFRFNKYYLLNEIEIVNKQYCFLDNSDCKTELINNLESQNFNFNIYLEYSEKQSCKYRITSARHDSLTPRYCYRNISSDIFSNFLHSIFDDEVLDSDHFIEFMSYRADANGKVVINIRETINLYGHEKLANNFRIMLQKLEKKKDQALNNLNIHELRSSLF